MSPCNSKQVRIVDEHGRTRFNRLLDDGTDVLQFDRYGGYVNRVSLRPGESVVSGWVTLDEMDKARDEIHGPGWREFHRARLGSPTTTFSQL